MERGLKRDMTDKTLHAQCIIERYRSELSDRFKRHTSYYNHDDNFRLRQYYCFPHLYSALFYDPSPEQIKFIGTQAHYIENHNVNFFLFAENMMKFAPVEIGEVDFEKWKERSCPGGYYLYYRALLIFGSAHPNGFFREQCLEHFVDDDLYDMIGYTLIRFNDTVPQVRRTAMKIFYELMRKERAAEYLVNAMPYVEHVRRGQKAKRSAEFSMDYLDSYIMETFERNADTVLKAYIHTRRLCYKLFFLHPEPKYRDLIIYFFKNECSYELRCLLERIYIKMSGECIPDEVQAIFANDENEHVRLIAYEYRLEKEGIWEGFEQLLFSESAHIRNFARRNLKKTGFDILKFCRDNLPQSLWEFANSGTKDDIPLIRQYLDQYPREAMYALVKLGTEDSKDIVLKNMHSDDPVLAKAAFRIAGKALDFDKDELKNLIYAETDFIVQWRLIKLFTKNGVWKVMPDLLHFTRDLPKQRGDLLYLLKRKTGHPVYLSMDYNKEIQAALRYAGEANAIPYYINNQIFTDMKMWW